MHTQPWMQRRAEQEGARSTLFGCCIGQGTLSHLDAPCEEHQITSGSSFEADLGPVFVDGSCSLGTSTQFAHAAWAAVQIDARGNILRSIAGNLDKAWPQNAINAEHMAWVKGAMWANAPVEVVADCQSVIDHWQAGDKGAGRHNDPQAGFWRTAEVLQLRDKVTATTKTKAHKDLRALEDLSLIHISEPTRH
eukprot:8244829-Karenia_brevis.AAC.1